MSASHQFREGARFPRLLSQAACFGISLAAARAMRSPLDFWQAGKRVEPAAAHRRGPGQSLDHRSAKNEAAAQCLTSHLMSFRSSTKIAYITGTRTSVTTVAT